MSASPKPLTLVGRALLSLRLIVWGAASALLLLAIILVILSTRDSRFWYPMLRAWASSSLAWFGVRVEGTGSDRLTPGRDFVILANHRSHLDIFALIQTLDHTETRWVAKRELAKVPLFGYALKLSGQILIDRHDHEQALRELQGKLGEHGASIVFFAEGQRSATRALLPFKKGGAAFAIAAGLPLVPVAVSGSERVLKKHSKLVRPGTIRIEVGEPIATRAAGADHRDLLTREARDRVVSMLEKIEGPIPTRDRAPREEGESSV
jgi:1-acyl-sn-glycerol-3-phosphate acyltransferase